MSTLSYLTPRILLSLVATITIVGPYIADWNETHIYNPNWPGHAKFHNAQTLSLGVCLGVGTLWKTWLDNTDDLFTAGVFAALYYITMISAWFYPGVTAFDPPEEYAISFPHVFVFGPNLAMVGLALWLEGRRVRAFKGGKED